MLETAFPSGVGKPTSLWSWEMLYPPSKSLCSVGEKKIHWMVFKVHLQLVTEAPCLVLLPSLPAYPRIIKVGKDLQAHPVPSSSPQTTSQNTYSKSLMLLFSQLKTDRKHSALLGIHKQISWLPGSVREKI